MTPIDGLWDIGVATPMGTQQMRVQLATVLRRTSSWDSSVQDIPASIRFTEENCRTSRILLGSDEIFASLPEAITCIEHSPDLTVDEKHAILDENAQRLLGLAPVRAAAGAVAAS